MYIPQTLILVIAVRDVDNRLFVCSIQLALLHMHYVSMCEPIMDSGHLLLYLKPLLYVELTASHTFKWNSVKKKRKKAKRIFKKFKHDIAECHQTIL